MRKFILQTAVHSKTWFETTHVF